jgi:acetyl-CoA carboxylase carboxyl transferase subunit alpha
VEDAAAQMKMTAADLHELGIADRVLAEPPGGAHRDPDAAAVLVGDAIADELAALDRMPPGARVAARYDKFRRMGSFLEPGA